MVGKLVCIPLLGSFLCGASWFFVAPSTGGFVPTNDPNLAVWFDMSDAANYSAPGGIVASINDKSGHGNIATAGVGAVSVTPNAQNGNSVFTFSSSALGFNPNTILDPALPFSVYIVHRFLAQSGVNIILTTKDQSAFPPYFGYATGGGYGFFGHSGIWTGTSATFSPGTTNYHIVAFLYNGSGGTTIGNFSTYVDGVLQTTVAGSNDDGSGNAIASYDGSATTPGARLIGAVGEIIISKSTSTYTQMAGYLSNKWGI